MYEKSVEFFQSALVASSTKEQKYECNINIGNYYNIRVRFIDNIDIIERI